MTDICSVGSNVTRGRTIYRHPKVQVVSARFPYGSGEDFIEAEVRALLSLGIFVELNPTRRWGRRRAGTEDLVVVPRSYSALVKALLASPWRNRGEVGRVVGEMLRDRPHLLKNLAVLAFGLESGSRAARAGVTHIHAHWLSTSGTVAWVASRVGGVPFSVTAHRWDIVDGNLAKPKVRDAAFVRTISERGRQQLVALGAAERVPVIHMGVEVPEEQALMNREASQPLRLVCPANMVPVKGHQHLLRAMALCRGRAVIDLAGQGPEHASIVHQIAQLRLEDAVHLRGQVPHAVLLADYVEGRYDAVVLPSVDLGAGEHEGIPVSLMEAMAAGLPVISTRTGAISELVSDGDSGLLVAPASPEELATAIRMLADHPEHCRQMGRTGRRRVEADFSATASATMLLSEITRVRPSGDAG